MIEIKKVCVLGSNSFTGSHFINYLLENTNVEVIGISRSEEYAPILLPYLYKKNPSERFRFFKLDLNKDFDKVTALLDKEKPEVLVNYSAQGEVRNSWKWPEQWFQTNTIAIVKLANFLKDKEYLKKYVSISTPEVYGETSLNMKENNNYGPSTPYGASKLAGDLFLMTLFKKYNFPVIFTRSANVYGIHQQLYRIIPRTVIYLKLGKTLELHGLGKSMRTFIHVKDVADATWKAILKGKNGEVYHLSPDNGLISIADLVKKICDKTGHDFSKSVKLIEENFGQDSVYSLSNEKARKEIGWQPKISLQQGISEVVTWINENWEEIQKMPLDYIHKT